MAERVKKLFEFLAVIFGKDDYMSEVDAKECLYYIKFIKSCIEGCLDGQEQGMIPVYQIIIYGSHDGKIVPTINCTPDKQIQKDWLLSELTARLMYAINDWDKKDIGQKEGKIVDMMSKLGWVRTI